MFNKYDFENYVPSSVTKMYQIDKNINLGILFSMLPLEPYNFADKRFVIQRESCGFQEFIRRIPMHRGRTYMKNAILLRLEDKEDGKSYSMKINSDKIHICGIKSFEIGETFVNGMIKIIMETFDTLRKVSKYRDEIFSFLSKHTEVIEAYNDLKGSQELPETCKLWILNQLEDYRNSSFGTDVSRDMNIFTRQILVQLQIDSQDIPESISIVSEKTNMLKYNYNLTNNIPDNYVLDCIDFLRLLSEKSKIYNFMVEHDNRCMSKITVMLRREDELLKHTMKIYPGRKTIAHCGHDIDEMKQGYDIIMKIFEEARWKNRDEIPLLNFSDLMEEYKVEI